MNIVDDFNEKKYVVLKDVLDPDFCEKAVNHFFELYKQGATIKDEQCPLSDSVYGDIFFDKLLEDLMPFFSEISGKKLTPTYSYGRIYRKGEELKIHYDRPACEISATLMLGLKGNDWPIYFSKSEDKSNSSKLVLQSGDAILYKGCESYHWRDAFDGEWQCQIFLHYVDSEGPYKDEKFDRRDKLNLNDDVFYYWQFENVLSSEYCQYIINKYSEEAVHQGEIGGISNSSINLNIRNVKNINLPLSLDIGPHLIGNAFIANQQAWKFDINTCNQIEYLKYTKNGKYNSHLDILHSEQINYQRKLTCLAFLNDNYEGGKMYIQPSENKIYPLQTKGTVIVFPSYYLHGVEEITEGIRHSVVCWMLGPRLK